MKAKRKNLILSVGMAVFVFCGHSYATENPKYVFYFIGDGMANVQIHAAEAYRAAI